MIDITKDDLILLGMRVVGNGALAFFTVLAATNMSGLGENLWACVAGAAIQGGLAGAQEIKRWVDKHEQGKETGKDGKPPLPTMTLM